MYDYESGVTSATAIFSEGTGTFEVTLSNKTFVPVGRVQISDPELIEIKFLEGNETLPLCPVSTGAEA